MNTTVEIAGVLLLAVADYATNILAYFTRHRVALAVSQAAAEAMAHTTEHYDGSSLAAAAGQNTKIIGQARVTLTDLQRAFSSQA